MRCRAILLLVFALAGAARVAMAINDPPHYLFPLCAGCDGQAAALLHQGVPGR